MSKTFTQTQNNLNDMKIIGIDPGYERVGIAVLEKNKTDRKETVLYSNCFKTNVKLTLDERIFLIGKEIEKIIEKYKPSKMAIEKLFFENNAKTAMGVSEARGAIVFVAQNLGLTVLQYTPLQIKSAVTGYGKADKNAVHTMVHKLVEMPKEIKQDDEIDAVAVAVTAFATEKL
ncbi:MAG: crossover junction endodeoxyribonuclease RuvC [Patescibacteria group bacterium]|nr:crossover junction endodeoxyribonuclease RuvC [Patescibacteria group bacterium]